MILALSFVPPADVPTAFEELVDSFDGTMTPLVDYWEDNYIGRQRRNRLGNPRFSIDLWNVHERVVNGLPRTNNSIEAWHRSFQLTAIIHRSLSSSTNFEKNKTMLKSS